jgi:hypothetical protein
MVVLMEDIMLEIELHKRFYNQVFIGLPFLKMVESLFYLVMNAKELVIFLDAMKCLMSTHASVLVDSVGPPSAEVCRAVASFP